MDVGRDECTRMSLTLFGHSNAQSEANWSGNPDRSLPDKFTANLTSRNLSLHIIVMHVTMTSFSSKQSKLLAGIEFTEIATDSPSAHY